MTLKNLKYDLPAGIVVFLVALPLCLGIALASGAPLFSGIVSGIIGGIAVGLISGSKVSVSGPAAGLAAVVLAALTKLGAFDIFLVSVLIAGIVQIGLGLFRAGFIADYIPSSVIKGLLAAIGLLLILKQLPHAIGYDPAQNNGFSLLDENGSHTLTTLTNAFDVITPGALLISVVSMLVLLLWDKIPFGRIKALPAPLFVVVAGVILNLLFNEFIPYLQIAATQLVDIPPVDTNNLGAYLHLPDPVHFTNADVWVVGITIAVVASLETLLNVQAIDKLDPHKRTTPANRELVAQGAGNVFASLLGGLPLTSVIVRSSVNLHSGNRTKASAVFHGVLLLASVLALGPIMNLIPLSALAAILIFTGYKLAKVSLFHDMFKKGWDQFLPFVITVAAIVLTDLLTGVLIGIVVSLFFLMRSNFRMPYSMEQYRLHIGEVIKMDLPNQVSFLNKATIKNALWNIPNGSKLVIDASNADYIDHDVLETIEEFQQVAVERDVQLNVLGLRHDYQLSDPVQFQPVLDKDTRDALHPTDVLQLLRDGNERFRSGRWTTKYYLQQTKAMVAGQHPMAVVVSCIDSRTAPEIIFDAGLGDVLTIRIAGNVINREIIGSLEIAHKLGAKLIVVKGHSSCGAIGLALKDEHAHNIGAITGKIGTAVRQCGCGAPHPTDAKTLLEQVTRRNVENSLVEIIDGSSYLREFIERGEMALVGAYHDIGARTVEFGELVTPANVERYRQPEAATAG
jgi:carbonic anhydrase